MDWIKKLEIINSAYYKDPDDISDRIEAFAQQKELVKPFENPPEKQV